MKKLIFFLLGITSFTFVIAQDINMQPCVKACIIFYVDESGSMDSAIVDLYKWVKGMRFISTEEGYVEASLYSFDEEYNQWCTPTGDKKILLEAVDDFCNYGIGGGTNPFPGLAAIDTLFTERRERDPTEWQIVLIHSDYYWNDGEKPAVEEIQRLICAGVTVILSVPKAYDGVRTKDVNQTNESNYEIIENLGGKSIRSNFGKFKEFLEALEPRVPCG